MAKPGRILNDKQHSALDRLDKAHGDAARVIGWCLDPGVGRGPIVAVRDAAGTITNHLVNFTGRLKALA